MSPGSEPIFTNLLRDEFDAGIAMAADPLNANLPELARRETTIHSPWFARTCKVCRHKFREGDRVRLCPRCDTPYHDDERYGLRCWHRQFAAGHVCTEGGRDRFRKREIAGCKFTWSGHLPDDPAPDEAGAVSTAPAPLVSLDETLVTQFVTGLETVWRPFGEYPVQKVGLESNLVGRTCPWCRFQVRAGDWVVACPCGCGAYFHQDIFRHLTCWNEWNGVEGNNFCPITGRLYEEETADARD